MRDDITSLSVDLNYLPVFGNVDGVVSEGNSTLSRDVVIRFARTLVNGPRLDDLTIDDELDLLFASGVTDVRNARCDAHLVAADDRIVDIRNRQVEAGFLADLYAEIVLDVFGIGRNGVIPRSESTGFYRGFDRGTLFGVEFDGLTGSGDGSSGSVFGFVQYVNSDRLGVGDAADVLDFDDDGYVRTFGDCGIRGVRVDRDGEF